MSSRSSKMDKIICAVIVAATYFPLFCRVSSAQRRLTSEFGMGSGVSTMPSHHYNWTHYLSTLKLLFLWYFKWSARRQGAILRSCTCGTARQVATMATMRFVKITKKTCKRSDHRTTKHYINTIYTRCYWFFLNPLYPSRTDTEAKISLLGCNFIFFESKMFEKLYELYCFQTFRWRKIWSAPRKLIFWVPNKVD